MTQQDHKMALPQGTRLQDFEFHRVLGHGGFGITYLGWNLRLGIPVAIKEYLPAELAVRERDRSVAPRASGDEETFQWGLDRFLDEARALARFKHPNIVQSLHYFEAHGTAYIAMEYVEGETLDERLKRQGTLDEDELKSILLPLLDGLAQVHAADLLHRDIKPANIMLRDADGSPVLVDFGSARQATGARTRSMTAIVTPGYGPIEQYSTRGRQGPWTDLYALGGVCYRALTGNAPQEATERVRNDPQVSVVEAARGKAAPAFLRAIDWALQVDEGDRPQDVAAWRTALLAEGEVPVQGTPTQTSPGRKTGNRQHEEETPSRWWHDRIVTAAVALSMTAVVWGGWHTYQAAEEAEAERRAAEEAEAERRAAEEAEAERRAAEEARQMAEAKRKAEAEKRAAEARRRAESKRKAEAEKQAAEAQRKAEKAATEALFSLLTQDDVTAEAAHKLIVQGADVNAKDKDGNTPLHIAARFHKNPEITQALLAAGASASNKNQYGWTPLHGAARFNDNPEIIKALLAVGADANAKDADGDTPLQFAAMSNKSPGVIATIIAAGVDANAENEHGYTSLHIAAQYNKKPEIIQALLAGGANVNATDGEDRTPLYWAAVQNKNPAVIRALLDGGADVNAKTKRGSTPHDVVQEGDNQAVIRKILENAN